jgi:hypothetical protein
MVYNQLDVNEHQLKSLSFDNAVKLLSPFYRKLNQYIPMVIQKGRDEGISDNVIRKRLDEAGIPYKTLIKHLPKELKEHQERYHEPEVLDRELTNSQERSEHEIDQKIQIVILDPMVLKKDQHRIRGLFSSMWNSFDPLKLTIENGKVTDIR